MPSSISESYKELIIEQNWDAYTAHDHQTWSSLIHRLQNSMHGRMCDEYVAGFMELDLPKDRVVRFEELADTLGAKTGWEYVAVNGFLEPHDFFKLLANRKFPANRYMRNPQEQAYQELPDIFHDVIGHAPLLMDPVMADFMQTFGQAGNLCKTESRRTMLARLYWFTVEVGLMKVNNQIRAYGAAIASSDKELAFALESHSPNRLEFSIERVFRTPYNMYDLQETYFVTGGLKDMLKLAENNFACVFDAADPLEDIARGTRVSTDLVISAGDHSYHDSKLAA